MNQRTNNLAVARTKTPASLRPCAMLACLHPENPVNPVLRPCVPASLREASLLSSCFILLSCPRKSDANL